jgi:hypothetical protein
MSIAELARQRMTAPAKPQAEGDGVLDGFVQSLTRLTFFAIEQKKEADAAPIIEYLNGVVKEPEGLKTGCAISYSESGRVDIAETMLREVLAEKPDYEPALAYMAALMACDNKGEPLNVMDKLLVTSFNPTIRAMAKEFRELILERKKIESM